jgi:MFS family permease
VNELPRPSGLSRLNALMLRAHVPTERDFWLLWLIGLILNISRQLEIVAMAIFTYRETSSPFIVALIVMLRMLPMGLFGALLGALTDHFERRTCVILIAVSQFVTTLALVALVQANALQVWHLAAASFIGGIGWAADFPARRMMMADRVGLDRLNIAMSLDAGSSQAARVAGPALGGIVFAALGLGACFTVEAALGAVALLCAWAVRYRNTPLHTAVARVLGHVVDGLKASFADGPLRSALLVTVIFNVFVWPCTSMIPVIGQDRLLLDADGIGLLVSMEGVGALAASILIGIWARPGHYPAIYIGGCVLAHAMLLIFAAAANAWVAGSALLFVGWFGAGFSVMQATFIYRLSPPQMRGRVLGLISVCIGFGPLGYILVGALANLIGANAAVATTAGAGLVALALLHRQWRLLLRKTPDL